MAGAGAARMTPKTSDVSATLADQRRHQVRFHSRQAAWFDWIPVLGFGLSSAGLVAARVLAPDGVGLSTPKLALLWFGFLFFGLGLVGLMTWRLRLRPRIVPYFARQIEAFGGRTSAAFRRGRGLYRDIVALDTLADALGVTRLSSFGFGDDYYGQEIRWHSASEGLRTVDALREGLGEDLRAVPDVLPDLETLATVLRVAADLHVDLSLTLRIHKKDSLQVVSSMERRQRSFW